MPVTPREVAGRARRLYERSARDWAVAPALEPRLEVPLHPPTEREALADLDAARAWVESWRRAEKELPIAVTWEERGWSRVGRQELPVRVQARGAASIAAVAGRTREWAGWATRIAELRAAVIAAASQAEGSVAEAHARVSEDAVGLRIERVDGALRTHSRAIALLDPADAAILQSVVAWLIAHPVSGLRVRQVPVRGIHTKWLERHRAMVEAIVAAATGTDGLGLLAPEDRLRVAILDRRLRPGGVRDLTAPISELAGLEFGGLLEVVIVVENLESLLALPDADGIVAIHSGGYAGHRVAGLPWARELPVLYWGDLDSHGFAILNRIRAHGVNAESVLMDRATLEDHRDLWVDEPAPFRGELPRLTEAERAVFELLRESGDVRLEQERIEWQYAWGKLAAATPRGAAKLRIAHPE